MLKLIEKREKLLGAFDKKGLTSKEKNEKKRFISLGKEEAKIEKITPGATKKEDVFSKLKLICGISLLKCSLYIGIIFFDMAGAALVITSDMLSKGIPDNTDCLTRSRARIKCGSKLALVFISSLSKISKVPCNANSFCTTCPLSSANFSMDSTSVSK